MRAVFLYHPDSEFNGLVRDYKRDFEFLHPDKQIELVSLDEADGSDLAKLYDVVRYPALLITASDGSLQRLWQDRPLPLMDEVAAYLR